MKKLSDKEVERLVKISYLELDNEFINNSAQSLTNIINWVQELKSIDTSSVQPMFCLADFLQQNFSTWRNDDVVNNASVNEILLNVPEKEDVFIVVPKVIE